MVTQQLLGDNKCRNNPVEVLRMTGKTVLVFLCLTM